MPRGRFGAAAGEGEGADGGDGGGESRDGADRMPASLWEFGEAAFRAGLRVVAQIVGNHLWHYVFDRSVTV
jgi:hypothetical protein